MTKKQSKKNSFPLMKGLSKIDSKTKDFWIVSTIGYLNSLAKVLKVNGLFETIKQQLSDDFTIATEAFSIYSLKLKELLEKID